MINGVCSIVAPNQFVLEWVKDRFSEELSQLTIEHLKIKEIKYIVSKNTKKTITSQVAEIKASDKRKNLLIQQSLV